MGRIVVHSKLEALHILGSRQYDELELDYASAWRDAAELGRLGLQRGIRVTARGTDYVMVASLAALEAGLARAKTTYRQRNLHCDFPLSMIPASRLRELERMAALLGDCILAGAQLRARPHERWV
ncbi:PHA-granule associated protein 4 [Cupriavidus sp. PET2-C1]